MVAPFGIASLVPAGRYKELESFVSRAGSIAALEGRVSVTVFASPVFGRIVTEAEMVVGPIETAAEFM
jgi:hypothetical protein